MKRIILTAIDKNPKYVDYLKAMLVSFAENAPNEKIKAYTLGYSLNLGHLNPNAESIAYRKKNHKNEASHIRGELICGLINEGYDQIGWFDPDIIARKPLDLFWEDITPGVLKVTYRKWQDVDYRKFQDGIYGIGISDSTKALIDRMTRKLKKHTEWYSDQLYLYKSYMKYKKKVKLINLPRPFNDNHFGEDSAIWHCHMKIKDSSPLFNNEFNKYLRMANG